MLISANNRYQGLTMDRILAAARQGQDAAPIRSTKLFDILIEEGGSVSTVYDHHTEKDMNLAMVQPWCAIGSDGVALAIEGPLRRGHPHPRSFGTFPRVLGVYVRRLGLLQAGRRGAQDDLAKRRQARRSRIAGCCGRALTRISRCSTPTRVIDRATYAEPFHYSEGIEYVMVNGQMVLERGKHTGARPGRALRR